MLHTVTPVTPENVGGDSLWWRVAITEPGGRTVEVDSPSGYTLPDWRDYAERYHGPGCAVTPLAGLPKPFRGPVNLDEALAASCEGVGGITAEVFRSLLSPENLKDIEAGDIPVMPTLHAFAQSFAEGIRSGRIVVRESDPASGSIVISDAELEAARKGRTTVRQGTFTGAHEVAP